MFVKVVDMWIVFVDNLANISLALIIAEYQLQSVVDNLKMISIKKITLQIPEQERYN